MKKKMLFISKLAALSLLLSFAVIHTAHAERGVTIKNKTTSDIFLAYAYHNETAGAQVCIGWKKIGALQTEKFRLDTRSKNFYFFGKSDNKFWPAKSETEGADFFVVDGDFLYKTETEQPEGENLFSEFFKRVTTNIEGNWTIDLLD